MTEREKYLGVDTDLDGEVWKHLDMTNYYYISNMGRVRSEGYIIRQQHNKKTGLCQAMVYTKDGKPKLLNVQSWVAKMFLPEPPDDSMTVRHISDNLLDNRASNLCWGYGGIHKNIENGIYVNGAKKPTKPEYKYIVKQKTLNGLVIGTFVGFEILEKLGFKRSQIMLASKGKYYKNSYIYKSHKWEVTRLKK